jgi:hypothetical protein
MNDDASDLRANSNKCFKCALAIARSNTFGLLIAVCILLNTVVLAMDRYPISKNELLTIEYSNLLFYFVFLFEMVVYLMAIGFQAYWADVTRRFDFCLVIISTIDLVY